LHKKLINNVLTNSSINNSSSAPNDLYLLIARGDEQAFRQAHDLFKTRLFFYARRFRLEWDEVKDVVADAFLGLWNSRTQLQSN
jgi:DNA-directed RNA polymerase specialized sigma24 family protein